MNQDIKTQLSLLAHKMFARGEGEVFLYGSRAKGESVKDSSDWDILVLTDDNISTDDNYASFAFPYAEIGWKFGAQVTPIHYTRSEWDAERNTSFYRNVVNTYVRL